MVEVSANRPGNCFQCPRCGSEATYYFDSPFCAITGDSLAYLAYCPRCGQVKYSSPLLSVDLGCPTCLGELVLTTIWDTPQRTDPGRCRADAREPTHCRSFGRGDRHDGCSSSFQTRPIPSRATTPHCGEASKTSSTSTTSASPGHPDWPASDPTSTAP